MTKRLILFALASLTISCGSATSSSSTPNRSNTTVAKTNVNAERAVPYSQTENAYTFAQISHLARILTPSGTKQAKEIVGKTVTESGLWQNKEVNKLLKEIMGAAELAKMKKYWNTETPIKKFGDFLIMTGCELHNCGDNQYAILMDLGDGRINVMHFGKRATREWTANRKIDDLPPPFEEDLAAMRRQQ